MVFNKLRKGERRSIGHLRSPRGSIDETNSPSPVAASTGNGSIPNSPVAASTQASPRVQQDPLHSKLQQELARNAENAGTHLPATSSSPVPLQISAPGNQGAAPGSQGYSTGSPVSPTRASQGYSVGSPVSPTRVSQNYANTGAGAGGARPQSIAPSVAQSNSGISTSPSQPLYFPMATVHNPAAAVLSSSPPGGKGGVSSGDSGWYMTTGVQPLAMTNEDSASLARSRSMRSSKSGRMGNDPSSPVQATSTLSRSLGARQPAAAIPEISPATEKKYDQIYRATGLPDTTTAQAPPPPALNAIRGAQPTGAAATTNTTRYSIPQNIPERQPEQLPLAVANAAGAAQAHRRQLSGSSPRMMQQQQQGFGAAAPASAVPKLDTTTPAIAEMERRQHAGTSDPSKSQSKFTEQMDLVGRTSEDTARLPYFASSSTNGAGILDDDRRMGRDREDAPFSSLNPTAREYSAGDALPASEIAKQREELPTSIARKEGEGLPSNEAVQANPALAAAANAQTGDREPRTSQIPIGGMSSYHRGALAPVAAPNVVTPEKTTRGNLPVLPVQAGREEDPALPTAGAPQAPILATSERSSGFPNVLPVVASVPVHASPTGPREMRNTSPTTATAAPVSPTRAIPVAAAAVLPAPETTRTPTYGPELQTSRTTAPQKVIGSEKRRFTETPAPRMPFSSVSSASAADRALSILSPTGGSAGAAPAPVQGMQSAGPAGSFGNVASKIPHYMFVTYQAHVCEECVESDRKMHRLQHGGQEWAYEYKDSPEERDLPLSDTESGEDGKELVRKTGRRDFQDKVSLVPTASERDNNGGQPCQCAECLKNRETVKYAAENGLIEKIFEGRRHPLSEVIETITYTTIVRAPIIEETIETVWCEEPNCPECLAKDEEYRQSEYRRLGEAYPGAVVHETGDSATYADPTGAKNIWGITDQVGDEYSGEDIVSNKKRGLDLLLERAGHPLYNQKRGIQSSTEGRIVGGEEALEAHRERKHHGVVPDWLKNSEGYKVDGGVRDEDEMLHKENNRLSYEGVRRALSHEDPEVPFSTQHENASAARLQ